MGWYEVGFYVIWIVQLNDMLVVFMYFFGDGKGWEDVFVGVVSYDQDGFIYNFLLCISWWFFQLM